MIPRQLEILLDTFSKSELSKSLGYTNKSQITAVAIREFLRNYAMHKKFLDLIDVSDNEVKLMDFNVGKIIKLTIDKKSGALFCLEHKVESCIHTTFVSELPRFTESRTKPTGQPTMRPKQWTDEEMVEEIRRIVGSMKAYSVSEISNEKMKKIIKILED